MRLLSLQSGLALNLADSKSGMAVRMKKDRIKKNVAKSVELFGGSSKSMLIAEEDGRLHCMIPMVACIRRGEPLPASVQNEGVKMCCTNDKCEYARQLVHTDCFEQLENTLIKIISNLGSARGWTDIQRRNNLWEKKGLTLVQKHLRCHCGLGLMTRDTDFYKRMDENGTPSEIKSKKKKKKELPKLNYGNNTVVAPGETTEVYKKKFSDSDSYYRDDSFDDCNVSIASTEISWQKNNSLLFETPKRSAQCKQHQLGSNSTQLPRTSLAWKSDQPATPVSVWKTVPSAAPTPVKTSKKKIVTPLQVAAQANEHQQVADNDPESLPEIPPTIANGDQITTTSTLPLTSWTSIVQSSLAPVTMESPQLVPVQNNHINERKNQREYAASIAGQCESIAGNARKILVYTLFGNNAPSFLLGERIMANFYLPKDSFC